MQELAQHILLKKEGVEIGAFGADDAAVEHGVNVVRPAFGRADAQTAVHERLQNGARHGRFAAAAVCPGQNEPGNGILHGGLLF